ncbi:MAG: hypothetical protein J0H85_07315 [Sediminibacterium magnilacihabitans]|jgi:hypothetical protein|nr:hypothetical protein [Sediminibacterium magnilacihabitans]PQV61121.1 hypothetical protein CLV53_104219 [Sediminibacterium magnilacihabitans]
MLFIKMLAVIELAVTVWSTGKQDLYGEHASPIAERVTRETKFLDDQPIINPSKLFTKTEADKIMGQSTHLADSSSKFKGLSASYLCAYLTDVKDAPTGKTGAIYFLFEQYQQISDAKKKYADIMLANKPHGIENINNLGDEAYFHTDKVHFYFIMVRKGKNVFNIKVNKITSSTSLKELNKIANRITALI